MTLDDSWRGQSKCRSLSPEMADKIFFPGSGGKPTRAQLYCSGCPVIAQCLKDAIENKLEGFMCGTTDGERTIMASIYHHTYTVEPLMKKVYENLPDEAKTNEKVRKVYRKYAPEEPYTFEYLESIEAPLNLIDS